MCVPPLRLLLPETIGRDPVQPYRHRGADIGLLAHAGLNHFLRHASQAARWIDEILRVAIGEVQIQLFHGRPTLILGQLFEVGVDRLIDIGELKVGLCRRPLLNGLLSGLERPAIVARHQE